MIDAADIHPNPTPFPELNEVLRDLALGAAEVLGDNFVGAYLHGSFSGGHADIYSDCDFLIPTYRPVTGDEVAGIRDLHMRLYDRPGHWNRHLEGAYPPVDELRTLDAVGRDWLSLEHSDRIVVWSTSCNCDVARWDMYDHGLTLVGPDPRTLVDPVGAEVIRDGIRARSTTFLPSLLGWTTLDFAWSQRYAVTTLSRYLYDFDTGRVNSKKAALDWVEAKADPRFTPLIRQVRADRDHGWDGREPTVAGGAEQARGFNDYVVAAIAAGGLPPGGSH